MHIFKKSLLLRRISIAKSLGFLFGLIGFFLLPICFNETDIFLRVGILLWYTSLGGIIWVLGVMNYHPILKMKMPFWFRGIFFGGWMNLVLTFFAYNAILEMMENTPLDEFSPFWIILEWAIIGLIIDFFSTRFAGEGKEILE